MKHSVQILLSYKRNKKYIPSAVSLFLKLRWCSSGARDSHSLGLVYMTLGCLGVTLQTHVTHVAKVIRITRRHLLGSKGICGCQIKGRLLLLLLLLLSLLLHRVVLTTSGHLATSGTGSWAGARCGIGRVVHSQC